MIKCPNCNAELSFDVDSQLVTCDYCRTTFDPNNLDVESKKAQELTYEGKSYLCSQCGAELLTFDETAITFCSYCGSQAMIESKMIKHNNPDFIIPFKKTKEQCINAYKNKVSKFFFAPKHMKSDIIVEKFRGIYIPYCVYKLSFHGKSIHKGSKYKYRSGDYEYFDDYKITADVAADYDGISYDLVSNFYDKFSHSIPYDFKTAEKFNYNYLAGFYADVADVNNSLYEKNATAIANVDSINHMRKKKEFAKYGCSNPRVEFKVNEKKIGMFPLYFLAIRDKKNEYVSYAVVNGQTGKVAVDLPIDFKKYILISLLLTVPMFLLINNFIVIIPKNICIFSIISAIISLIISRYQLKKIHERENHLDDIGYIQKTTDIEYKVQAKTSNTLLMVLLILGLFAFFFAFPFIYMKLQMSISQIFLIIISFVMISFIVVFSKIIKNKNNSKIDIKIKINNNVKISKKEKFKYSYKPVLSILIGIIALLLNFIDDIYYYGTALIMFVLIIWSFYDLINGHNLLTSTKLPQLNKRGGDENE